jgi:hypothetical protein
VLGATFSVGRTTDDETRYQLIVRTINYVQCEEVAFGTVCWVRGQFDQLVGLDAIFGTVGVDGYRKRKAGSR